MSKLLPDKHIEARDSLVGQAARLLSTMPTSVTVARAWALSRELFPQQPFSRFVLILDVLVALNLVELEGEVLVRSIQDATST